MCISIYTNQCKNIKLYKAVAIWLLFFFLKAGPSQGGFYTENSISYKWTKINVKGRTKMVA